MSVTFDATYYLQNNLDVLTSFNNGAFGTMTAAEAALYHYSNYGWKELRNPSSSFNTSYYLTTYSDVLSAKTNPLDHFVAYGASEGRAPNSSLSGVSSTFDGAAYITANTDVAAAGFTATTAYQHWVLYGSGEGRAAYTTGGTLISGSTTTGSTYTLTTSIDTLSGTSAAETFDASRAISGGTAFDTLNNSDSVDGGAGTDTLFAQLTGAGATTTIASLKNVEIVSVEVTNAGGDTLSLANGDTSITTVKSSNNAGALTVSNIQSAPTAYELSNTAANFTATVLTSKLTGTTDAATLSVSNVTAGTVTLGNVTAGSGYETVSITSSGTVANVLTALDDGLGNSLGTVNVSGSNALTLALTPTTVTKVDANAFTAALTLTAAATNGQAMSVIGGTGNDVINVNGYTTTDTINGGTGTDRLVVTNAEATLATATQSNVSGIEVVGLSDTTTGGTITVSNFGATGLKLGTAVDHTGAVVANFAAGTSSFDRGDSTDNANEATTLTVAGVATTDIMGVTLGTSTTTTGSVWGGTGAFTINGAESVNVLVQGGAATIGGALTLTNTAATETITVTGSQNLTITGLTTADAVNASGMTGTATLTMGGGGANSMTITGTGNADVLVGGTAADIISGGAGADTIQNAVSGANSAANDVLTGSTGYDTFRIVGSVAATATTYSGVALISDFTVGSTAAASDILSFDITDASYGTSALGQEGAVISAQAAGAVAVQSVAQNAAAAAMVTGGDLIKLTTGVAFTTDVQTTYAAAIGSATVTGAVAARDYFGTYYDTTNSRMVIFNVDPGAADTTISSADTVVLVGTVSMTAADYASFGANNFNFVNY